MRSWTTSFIVALVFVFGGFEVRAEWPTLRGSVERGGFVAGELKAPFRLAWVRHFVGERMGTAVEPIVGGGNVFAATHAGSVYALDAETGRPRWLFRGGGPFLASPAYAEGILIAACTDGVITALDVKTGAITWSSLPRRGGFAASPAIAEGRVFIGSRTGNFYALDLHTGAVIWQCRCAAPVRQAAAYASGKIYVMAEDLCLRALDSKTGRLLWTSRRVNGQSARDYYPVIARDGEHTVCIVRTSPVETMSRHIGRDRSLLCRLAGVDETSWKTVDRWIKSDEAQGNPEGWEREQAGIVAYLKEQPTARTFSVFDAETGKERRHAPVLWCAGCQGVGAPPVRLPDGRLLVFYRSAYGNWNHGVAPLVGLGLLNLAANRITPLSHGHGRQPPWNTFWGTADESQNFQVVGNTVLIVHQGTLSAFDLTTRKLSLICGKRDTWGGFPNLPWARNEWHGPGRGGVAVVGKRLYWQTGSRILCIVAGDRGEPAPDTPVEGEDVPVRTRQKTRIAGREEIISRLRTAVEEVLSARWAPLYVEPGLAGREFFFQQSGELFAALSLAYSHLPAEVRARVKQRLAEEWGKHPPFSEKAWYSLREGKRRETFTVPSSLLEPRHDRRRRDPFGNCQAMWLYAGRCGEWARVRAAWPHIKALFKGFQASGWELDPTKGALEANRYHAAVGGFAAMAMALEDRAVSEEASVRGKKLEGRLVDCWQRAARGADMPVFRDIAAWDAFHGKGSLLFKSVSGHRAKLALFHELTRETAAAIRQQVPEATRVWQVFETLCPTWHLSGEERQLHCGENFVDPPDFALAAFRASVWLGDGNFVAAAARLDLPFCRADLTYVTKLAIALDLP